MKKIAIIGRPNVGKSSFFNRILRAQDAITSDFAGTTRDTKKRRVLIFDKEAEMVDTGGLDKGNELFEKIKEMSLKAAYEADIILYMADGRTPFEQEDRKLFYELEKMGKDIALVVNKLDNDKLEELIWEFHSLGTEHIFPISVSHNRRIGKLLEWIYERLPYEDIVKEEAHDKDDPHGLLEQSSDEEDYFDIFGDDEEVPQLSEKELKLLEDEERKRAVKVAIIGRVNVGKSSLLNALLGEERSVVSSVAGTTIDPIDETMHYQDKEITFVDTAGIRRRGKIEGIERYALMRTEAMLKEADVALLVLDASDEFKDLDEKIAGLVDKNRLATIIVLNKWDLTDKDYEKYKKKVRDRFRFLHYAEIISISALSRKRVHKILDRILAVNENYSQRVPTAKLNEVIEKAIRKHHLPSPNGQTIKIYFATQYDIRPPQIALIMNRPKLLHFSYRRYLTNQLREAFDFSGTPVLFKAKSKNSTEQA